MKSTLKKITPLLVVFTVLLSSQFIDAAWTAPSGTPSESNNAPPPINESAENQLKRGDITARTLKAGAQMWSAEYCDENGQNCFSAADVSTSPSVGTLGCQKLTAGFGDQSVQTDAFFGGLGSGPRPGDKVTQVYSGSLNITHIAVGSNYNSGYLIYGGEDERVRSSGFSDDFYDWGAFVNRDDAHMNNVRAREFVAVTGKQAKIETVGVNNMPMQLWYQADVDCSDSKHLDF